MKSRFNILILEDDKLEQEKLQQAFSKKFHENYKVFISSTVEELVDKVSQHSYLGMSLDHKVPYNNTNNRIAKKYDVDVINKLNKYHPLGYKSIYTAFPRWDSAKIFGAKINYVSKKDTPTDIWAEEFKKILLEYKKIDSYTEAKDVLFFPFSALVSGIIGDVNNSKTYQQLFTFSIEMFYIVMLSILEKKEMVYCDNTEKQLCFILENLEELKDKKTPCSQELFKTLDSDFIEDMQTLNNLFQEKRFTSVNNECQDYMVLLLLKLNFFSANSFATKVKTRRNYLRQVEVEAEKIENRAFKTKEYITDFYELPKNTASTYLIFKDYNGKSYFLDVGDYLEIVMKEMGHIRVLSKLSNQQIFPVGE